ncbi:unnamed protein product [Closterium sp. NIES-54]
MDVWGPALVSGQSRERYFLLVVEDYTRYTTVFPLCSKGQVVDVLIPWIRTVRLQLREQFSQDLPVLRLHSVRGGEFSSTLLRDFCHGEGILQTFTLPDSPQQNGIAECRIGLVMEVARISMIHAAAPLFYGRLRSGTLRISSTSGPVSPCRRPRPHCVGRGRLVMRQCSGSGDLVPLFVIRQRTSSLPVLSLAVLLPQSEGAETGGAEPGGVDTGGAEPGGVAAGGAEPEGVEPGGAEPRVATSEGAESGGAEPQGAASSGVATIACVTGGTATAGPGGARSRGAGAAGTSGVQGARVGVLTESGTIGAGGAGAGGAGVGGPGVGGGRAGGAGDVDPGGTVRLRPYFVPLLQHSGSLTKRRAPASRPVSPVRTTRRVPRSRPPPVPGTHDMTLRPSSVPLRVPLPAPPDSSLPEVLDPASDRARTASPTVSRLLATAVTDPSFESAAASALVAELLDLLLPVVLTMPLLLLLSLRLPVLRPLGAAMDAEMASWKSTGTYVDEVPPPGANIVDGMWIFRVKRPPGSPPAFKARYDAQGFRQRQGVDYFQTFSPTPKMTTLRVLLHVAAQRDYELHSLDFHTAFLQGSLHEELWLRRPPGFTESFLAGTQWSLRRPVYGLRKAPRKWHDTLKTTLAALGFAPATADPSLFLRTDTSLPPFYVLVYVDDLVLQRFGFQFSSPQTTPLSTSHSLSAPPLDESVEPSGPYPELVGCLMYLMTCTRPDLAYPLSLLAGYVAPGRHRKVHWDAAKRVLRYLCSTSGMGLVLGGRGPVVLTDHADASWVDDSATQRPSQGYTFNLGSGSVSWQSTRSSSVLSSGCEAEIYAGAMAAQELRWLTFLLTDLGEQPRSPPVLYVDNKAMIALCQEHRLEHRTKHIALRYFLSRELQQRGQLRLAYVATRANTADVFTKALPPGDHQRFVTVLGLVSMGRGRGLASTGGRRAQTATGGRSTQTATGRGQVQASMGRRRLQGVKRRVKAVAAARAAEESLVRAHRGSRRGLGVLGEVFTSRVECFQGCRGRGLRGREVRRGEGRGERGGEEGAGGEGEAGGGGGGGGVVGGVGKGGRGLVAGNGAGCVIQRGGGVIESGGSAAERGGASKGGGAQGGGGGEAIHVGVKVCRGGVRGTVIHHILYVHYAAHTVTAGHVAHAAHAACANHASHAVNTASIPLGVFPIREAFSGATIPVNTHSSLTTASRPHAFTAPSAPSAVSIACTGRAL